MKAESSFGAYYTGAPRTGFVYGVSSVTMSEPAEVDAYLREAGFAQPARVKQVHGHRIVSYDEAVAAEVEADAIVLEAGQAAVIRVADCVPVVLLNRKERRAAVVHAGWRGTFERIVAKAARLVGEPADLSAYIGPAICGSCYEVDVDLARKFESEFGAGPWILPGGEEGRKKPHLDLRALNRSLLADAGVGDVEIEIEAACTFEDPGLHSFRRDADRAGRIGAFVGVKSE